MNKYTTGWLCRDRCGVNFFRRKPWIQGLGNEAANMWRDEYGYMGDECWTVEDFEDVYPHNALPKRDCKYYCEIELGE